MPHAIRCDDESPISTDSSGTRPANRGPTFRSSSGVSVRCSQAAVRTSALNIGEYRPSPYVCTVMLASRLTP